MDYVGVVLAEKRLGSRSYAKALLKLFLSAVGDPRDLGSKALDMLLFLIEEAFRDEHRHADVFVSELLEACVKDSLNVFPYRVAVGADNHAALYACVLDKLRFLDYVGVPLCKILAHRGYG